MDINNKPENYLISLQEKNQLPHYLTIVWVVVVLLLFTLFYFHKVNQLDWIFTGDTMNSFSVYSYQYSGFVRGEYPLWNPLVRTGQAEPVLQIFLLANPVSNTIMTASVFLGGKDVVLSYSIVLYTFILLYVVGIYLLVFCWTNNRCAGVFALILALGSSSVFWVFHHSSFILILHAIPWMLYAATMYFRDYNFKYLIIFALAYNSALYSYMIAFGLSFIVMLLISMALFYHKKIINSFQMLSRIPLWHMLAMGSIIFIVSLPAFFSFIEFEKITLPFSRASNIQVTDSYTLSYEIMFSRLYHNAIFSPSFWSTLFTGTARFSYEALRHYVGPVALLFIFIAAISFRRFILCICLSVLFILILASGTLPSKVFFMLPFFSLVRNAHFLLQYSVVLLIMLAGFGFDLVTKRGYEIRFNASLAFMIVAILLCLWPAIMNEKNFLFSSIAAIIMLITFLLVKFAPAHILIISLLALTTATTSATTLLWFNTPYISGSTINKNKDLYMLRNRSDHQLQFLLERPSEIRKTLRPDKVTDFGQDEFSSYITLKDNSYKTAGGLFGNSSFPVFKSYYLFQTLPGSEYLMRKKFFFFRKCYTSADPLDMMEFKRNPELLEEMVKGGICITDQLSNENIFLEPFKPGALRSAPFKIAEDAFEVNILEYKANSIRMNISVDHEGLFAYTDLWTKDWNVWLDGVQVPIRKVFHTYKGVEITPGTHSLAFKYTSKLSKFILLMNMVFCFCVLGLLSHYIKTKYFKKAHV